MKIGILIDRLNIGGVEKIALEEVHALRALGEDVSLVVLSKKAVVENAFPDLKKDIPIIYLDERLPKWLRFTFKFPVFSFFSFFHLSYPFLIPFIVKPKEFDCLISHGTYTSFTAIGLKKHRNIPYLVVIWDPITYILKRVYSKKFPLIFQKILFRIAIFLDGLVVNNSQAVIVGGTAHNDELKRLGSTRDIVCISPAVHFPKINDVKKKNYILMVTAWKRAKNLEYIFDLLDVLPKLELKIVGKWIEDLHLKEFREQMAVRGFTKNIEIVGAVSEKELATYYTEALVLLQTNDDKGFGMPALEAAAHGTTFVIPQGQGVCDLFSDKVDGFYSKEHETSKIAEYLKLLIDDPQKAIAMGNHAQNVVKNNFTWNLHAMSLLEAIKKYKT